MNYKRRNRVSILVGVVTIALTISPYLSNQANPVPAFHWGMFTVLLAYTSSFGIPLPVGEVSLAPMVTVFALLVMGIYPTSLAVIFSDILYGLYRWLFPESAKWQTNEDGYNLVATTSANLTMHTLSVIAAGMVYYGFDGQIPITTIRDVVVLITMGAAYLFTNYLLAALYLSMRSLPHLRYLTENLGTMLVFEAIPLIFAPLAAAIWVEIGILAFLVFALGLVIASVVLRNQAINKLELERHIKELKGLQSVGQSLSAILDEDQIASAIYREVSKLMPADNFYLALYNADESTIHFPITYEHNVLLPPRSRQFAHGLTEHVIKTAKPLLDRKTCEANRRINGDGTLWAGSHLLAGCPADRRRRGAGDACGAILSAGKSDPSKIGSHPPGNSKYDRRPGFDRPTECPAVHPDRPGFDPTREGIEFHHEYHL